VSRRACAAWVGVTAVLLLLQSAAHLAVVLDEGRIGTIVDLDRSNGLPDLVSTLVLGVAAVGATLAARAEHGRGRVVAAALSILLVALTFADAVHDGAHPASDAGWLVITTVGAVAVLLAVTAGSMSLRGRLTLCAAAAALAGSFLVDGLEQIDPGRFQRKRGDPITEYQVVAKEGLELLGWSLVALALWDEALRRRGTTSTATAPASRGRAASRRRAA
jgi:hypothetical protein